jgi:LDH2 family malate/lactate/ureidoglycolate dehydrogenase
VPVWRAELERRRSGIPVDEGVWEKLAAEARRLGVEPPCC